MRFISALFLTAATASAAAAEKPLMRDFIGLCGHTVLFKPELYRPVCGWVRDYHPVEWDLGDETSVLPEWPFAKNRVSWQKVYGSWREAGLRCTASLMFESIKRPAWRSVEADLENYARSFAAEFGPSGKHKFLEAVEIGNEPGEWSDADYAMVLRAMSKGLRAGDPKLRIATCNLTTGKSGRYAKSVSCLEGHHAAFDILNLHVYAELEPWPTWRRTFPEDPALKGYLHEINDLCAWRDRHCPHKAVWITEFGYDATTRTPDPKSEFAKWQGVTERQQAEWLVRSILLLSSLPIERAAIFFFNDDDQPQLHGSSGLTRKFQPKPAWYAVAHLMKTLGDYRFNRIVPLEGLRGMEYRHVSDPRRNCSVAWLPAAGGPPRPFSIPVPAGVRVHGASCTPLTAVAAPAVVVKAENGTLTGAAGPEPVFVEWSAP